MEDSISCGVSGRVRIPIMISLAPTGSNAFRFGDNSSKFAGTMDFFVAWDKHENEDLVGFWEGIEVAGQAFFAPDLRKDAFSFFISAAETFRFLWDFDLELGVEGMVASLSQH